MLSDSGFCYKVQPCHATFPEVSHSSVCRLYSSAHFNDSFPQHSDPEVLKTPLEGVALIMKAMGIDKVRCLPGPFVNRTCAL